MSPARKQATARASGRATVRHAPQRNLMSIDLTKDELRALIVEQSRDGEGYVTVYRGLRAELITAGVPEGAFSPTGKGRKFQIKPTWPKNTILKAAMNPVDGGFELEIGWAFSPSPCGCGHPAVTELARIIMIEVSDWGGPHPWPANLERPPDAGPDRSSLWHTFESLAQHNWASGYKPASGSPRLRISAQFREILYDLAHKLYRDIQRECEIFAETRAPAERRPGLRLVANNTRVLP